MRKMGGEYLKTMGRQDNLTQLEEELDRLFYLAHENGQPLLGYLIGMAHEEAKQGAERIGRAANSNSASTGRQAASE